MYDLSQLSMKFERHLDAEVVDFEVQYFREQHLLLLSL